MPEFDKTSKPAVCPRHGPRLRRGCAGLTLVELMITLSVLVILTTIGIPSFVSLIHNNRVAVVANDLTLAFTLARSEAIKRGTPMRVCASTDGLACDITSSSDCSADWSVGWIVLPEAGGEAVRVQPAVEGDVGPIEQSGAPWIGFDNLGAARLPDCVANARAVLNIGRPLDTRLRTRTVELLPSGRVSLREP